MAQKTISLGASPDDGLGDSARAAGTKINENFEELYAAVAARALKVAPQFSTRTDLATTAFSASWCDDGAGMLGLFVGPVVLAVGYVLFMEWVQLHPPPNDASQGEDPPAQITS